MTGLAIAATLSIAAAADNGRSRDYWTAIRESDFAVPEGEQPYPLLVEMNELLGSTDPVLRDDVAYSAAARWVYRKRLLSAAEERQLLELWRGNLAAGIGESGTDSVLRRSFSALNLSLLAALDNEAPFMTRTTSTAAARGARLPRAGTGPRGYDPAKGWMHAPGTPPICSSSWRATRGWRWAINDACSTPSPEKCAAFGEVFAWGEDERLAQVVRSVARRADFDRAAFEAWLAAFPEAAQGAVGVGARDRGRALRGGAERESGAAGGAHRAGDGRRSRARRGMGRDQAARDARADAIEVAAMSDPWLTVIVPCYNEEQAVVGELARLREALAAQGACEIVVVDDGSTDATAARLEPPLACSPLERSGAIAGRISRGRDPGR